MSFHATSLASVLGLVLTCGGAHAQQVVSVPIDHPTIQSAVDALPPGGPTNTIKVAPGHYHENVVISGRNVFLVGDPMKPYSVIVDGMAAGSAASLLDGASVGFSGMTFQNGLGTTRAGVARGGGLFVESGSSLLMGDCLIRSNEAVYGGGIYASDADTLQLTRVELSDNRSDYSGGGALIYGPFLIQDCVFDANRSTAGGHLTCSATSSAPRVIQSCTFSGGSVTRGEHLGPLDESAGGAIHASISQGHSLVVADCEFTNCNSTDVGGAISCRQPTEDLRQRCLEGTYVCGRGTLSVTDCLFRNCVAPRGGAIAWSYEDGLELERCVFEKCLALSGGAILADSGAHRILESNFTECLALGQPGGAIRFEGCEADLLETHFIECGAGNSSGGAVSARESMVATTECRFIENDAAIGSAICVERSSLHDQGSVFERNERAYAVALECEDQTWGSEFIGSEFRNHGIDGGKQAYGAVRMSFEGPAEGYQPKGRFVDCTFESNRSSLGAAAIESAGMWVEVKTSRFTDNGALYLPDNDFVGGLGGAIHVRDARADIWTAQFERNFAQDSGGAIAAGNALVSVWECDFSNNAAFWYGGAIETFAGTDLSVTDSRFVCSLLEDGPLGAWDAQMGGAIDVAPGAGRSYFGGLLIEGHTAQEDGGGLWIDGDEAMVEDCLVRGNHAAAAGGAFLNAATSVEGSRFCGNTVHQVNDHPNWIDAGGNVFSATCCSTDLDGDGETGAGDLTILLAAFGAQGSSSLLVDLNGDARVDGADLSILLAEWGTPCGD